MLSGSRRGGPTPTDLRLGTTGRITDGEFVYEHDLKDRGLEVPAANEAQTGTTDYQWATEGGVDISVKASGQTDAAFQAVAAADVGFKLAFKKQEAMAIVYRGAHGRQITDQMRTGRPHGQVLERRPVAEDAARRRCHHRRAHRLVGLRLLLITLPTLGFVAPARVSWRCCRPPSQSGTVD